MESWGFWSSDAWGLSSDGVRTVAEVAGGGGMGATVALEIVGAPLIRAHTKMTLERDNPSRFKLRC